MLALIDIESWIKSGGILLLAAIVFAESGLFIGFFLPGDSMLFLAGFITASKDHSNWLPSLPLTALVVFAAAALGDQVGYIFGRKVGPSLFDRPESRFFKPAHVERAHAFLEKNGPKTILLARFVPVVRTFAPIVAGVGKMKYRTFVTFNLVGAFVWGVGVTTLGHFLGNVSFIKNNIEVASVGVVALSLIPVAFEFLKHRREAAALLSSTDSGTGH